MKYRITQMIALMLVGLGFCLNANAAGLLSPNKSVVAEKVIAAPDSSPLLASDTLIANPTFTADYALANYIDQPATQVNIDNTAAVTAQPTKVRRLEANIGPNRASQTVLVAASLADTAHRANSANIKAATAPG